MMIVSNEQAESLFKMYRANLKSQAKRLAKHQSIKVSGAYELISIMWGFENWYQLNKFLKHIEDVYTLNFRYEQGLLNLSGINQLVDRFQILGISQVAKSHGGSQFCHFSPHLVKRLENVSSNPKERDTSSARLQGYLDGMQETVSEYLGDISLRTGYYKDREVVSQKFGDNLNSLVENLVTYKGDTSQFNLLNTENERYELGKEILRILFGFDSSNQSCTNNNEMLDEPALEALGIKIIDDAQEFFGSAKNLNLTIKLSDLAGILMKAGDIEGFHPGALDYAESGHMSIAVCLAHLPSDALLTVSWRKPAKMEYGRLIVRSVSVEQENQLSRLLACGRPGHIIRFNDSAHEQADDFWVGIKYSNFQNGFTCLDYVPGDMHKEISRSHRYSQLGVTSTHPLFADSYLYKYMAESYGCFEDDSKMGDAAKHVCFTKCDKSMLPFSNQVVREIEQAIPNYADAFTIFALGPVDDIYARLVAYVDSNDGTGYEPTICPGYREDAYAHRNFVELNVYNYYEDEVPAWIDVNINIAKRFDRDTVAAILSNPHLDGLMEKGFDIMSFQHTDLNQGIEHLPLNEKIEKVGERIDRDKVDQTLGIRIIFKDDFQKPSIEKELIDCYLTAVKFLNAL